MFFATLAVDATRFSALVYTYEWLETKIAASAETVVDNRQQKNTEAYQFAFGKDPEKWNNSTKVEYVRSNDLIRSESSTGGLITRSDSINDPITMYERFREIFT